MSAHTVKYAFGVYPQVTVYSYISYCFSLTNKTAGLAKFVGSDIIAYVVICRESHIYSFYHDRVIDLFMTRMQN